MALTNMPKRRIDLPKSEKDGDTDSTCEFQRVRLEQEEDRDETALRTSVKDSRF